MTCKPIPEGSMYSTKLLKEMQQSVSQYLFVSDSSKGTRMEMFDVSMDTDLSVKAISV